MIGQTCLNIHSYPRDELMSISIFVRWILACDIGVTVTPSGSEKRDEWECVTYE